MGRLPKQTTRADFLKRLRDLGFAGPHSGGGDHPKYMSRTRPDGHLQKVKIPNPHSKKNDIGETLLKRILGGAGISHEEWLDG